MPIQVENKIPHFRAEDLKALAKILADTYSGLTRSQIDHILEKCHIPDVNSSMTKWKRLSNAFVIEQNKRQYGNHIAAFIHKAMPPVGYVSSPEDFEMRRLELNKVLAFSGLMLHENGRFKRVARTTTIYEAQEQADKLRAQLQERNVHEDVLKSCKAELLQKNYFHAVLEACKSVANKIRNLTGLTSDGAELAKEAFAIRQSGKPIWQSMLFLPKQRSASNEDSSVYYLASSAHLGTQPRMLRRSTGR